MGIFDVVPSNFFSILVSRNREIYVDALMLLHDMFKFELNIQVDNYIASLISLQEEKSFVPEDDDEGQEGSLTVNGKARLILNRLVKTGWVDKEFLDGSFIEIITPLPYAIPVMKLLSELSDGNIQEYNSLVFSTYSGLMQAKGEHDSQMYEAVLSAKANTEELEYQLRRLYHSIRGYLRMIGTNKDVNVLLANHFEEYKKMSDRIYHPIKTMDSIHRYMSPIQSILSDVLGDEELMQSMCQRAMTIKKYDTVQIAEQEIVSSIDFVLDAYQSLGGIVNQIDRKHSTYTKSSIEAIRYQMTADQSIKGKLVELLKAYASASAEIAGQDVVGNLLEKNITVNRQEFVDGKSLYHKSTRSRRLDSQSLAVVQDDSFSALAMGGMMEHIKNGYPIARVRAFVDTLFANSKDTICSADILITKESDFILLILAVVRASDKGMNYTVEMGEGQVESGGYRIPNMTIFKKGVKHHVE